MANVTLLEFADVPRSPRECYLYARDFSHAAEWEPGSIASRKLTPGPIVVGSEFEVDVRFAGREQTMHYAILSMTADEEVVLLGKGRGFEATDTIRFEPLPDGGTRISYQADFIFKKMPSIGVKALKPLLTRMGKKAVNGLRDALTPASSAPTASWWDKVTAKAVLPGMVNFTRRGYEQLVKDGDASLSARMDGKVVVVTGATDGLGKATTTALAAMGAEVILVSRNPEKLQRVKAQIAAETGNHKLHVEQANLTLLADTQRLADRLLANHPRIDVLINNAGALYNQRQETHEGFEQSLAILLLSPFLLTRTLMPRLRETAAAYGEARVVNVSSGGMYTQPVFLKDLQYKKGSYDGPKAYARAKRGLVAITERWAREEARNNVIVNSMHPGWAATPGVADSLPAFNKRLGDRLRTSEQGADTIIWLASAPEAAEASGKFWFDRKPRPTAVFPKTALNHDRAEQLFQQICNMIAGYTNANNKAAG